MPTTAIGACQDDATSIEYHLDAFELWEDVNASEAIQPPTAVHTIYLTEGESVHRSFAGLPRDVEFLLHSIWTYIIPQNVLYNALIQSEVLTAARALAITTLHRIDSLVSYRGLLILCAATFTIAWQSVIMRAISAQPRNYMLYTFMVYTDRIPLGAWVPLEILTHTSCHKTISETQIDVTNALLEAQTDVLGERPPFADFQMGPTPPRHRLDSAT